MDKPSTSGSKEGFVSSPAVGSTRQNHKSKTTESPDVPATKIRKIANEQKRQIQSAPNSQTIESSTNDNTPASFLSQPHKSQVVFLTTDIRIENKETRDLIKRAHIKQEKLRRKEKTLDENTEAMKKHMQKEVGIQEEIDERLNISGNFQTAVQEKQADIMNVFAGFKQRQILINEKYAVVVLNHQRIVDLKKQTEAENSKMKVNADRLEPMKNEVSLVVAETEQLDAELLKLTVFGNGVEEKEKQRDVILCRNQQRYCEGLKKIDDAGRNVLVEMDIVREKNIKLASALDENSGRKLQLLPKCEALRVPRRQRQDLIQHLNSRIRDFEESEASMTTKIEESKITNLAIISKIDVELADCRKQMEEHEANYAEKSKKISDAKSSNEKLTDSTNKSVDDIEKLEKISDSKECELEKLKEELTEASISNKALSAEVRNLKETLADAKAVIFQEKEDFATVTTENQSNMFEIEMKAKLADLRRQCKDKEDLISETQPEIEAETLEFYKKEAKLDEDIVKLDLELQKLQKSKENNEQDVKKLDSELKKKSNESTQASTQCLRSRHEKRVNEHTKKIETLRREISVIKAEYGLENKRTSEPTDKRKAELKVFKSDTDDLEKKISAARKKLDDLKNRSKKARIPLQAVNDAVPKSAPSSPLVGIISTRNKTPPAISTPEHSPEQARLGLRDKFGFENFSDESSINSSILFEDAQRKYVKVFEANKTDADKLSLTKLPKKY